MKLRLKYMMRSVLLSWILIIPAPVEASCDKLFSEVIKRELNENKKTLAPCPSKRIDKPRHRIRDVCYEPGDPNSRITIKALLRCKTSKKSAISASVSENVTITATAGRDCKINNIDADASGAFGSLIVEIIEELRGLRGELEDALKEHC